MPDSIALEGGHTFNRGSHLEGAWNPDRLGNEGNADSNYVGLTLTYNLKPQKTEVINWHDFPPPSFPLPNFVELPADLPPDEDTPADMFEQGLDAVEEADSSTLFWIFGMTGMLVLLGLVVLGIKIRMKSS